LYQKDLDRRNACKENLSTIVSIKRDRKMPSRRFTFRYLLPLTAVLLGLSAGAMYYQQPSSPSPAAVTVPPPERFAFGIDAPPVLEDAATEVSFAIPVVNRTAASVRFRPLRVACSCSAATIDRSELGAGEKTVVRLQVRPLGRTGTQTFRTEWEDDSGRTWVAGVRVTIYRREQFEPQELRLGKVQPGHELTREFMLRQVAPTAAELPPEVGFKVEGEGLNVVSGPSRIELLGSSLACRVTPLTVKVRVPDRLGRGEARVTLNRVSTVTAPTPLLTVDWSVQGVVEAQPARVVFVVNPDRRETSLRQSVAIRPQANGIRVIRVSTTDPSIHAEWKPDPAAGGGLGAIDVTLDLTHAGTSRQCDLVVETDTSTAPKHRIPVSVIVVDGG
jgi:hypothetical protein